MELEVFPLNVHRVNIMSRAVSQDDDDGSERELLSVARVTWRAEESSDLGPCHGQPLRRYFRPKVVSGVGCTVLYSTVQLVQRDIAPGCLGSWM